MTAATALIAGNDPLPELASRAVEQALARADLTHAQGVLLYLTPDFARSAQAAVSAASRAGNCLQVVGGIVSGIANERSWVFDRPAAAAMVFGDGLAIGAEDTGDHRLCLAAGATLPRHWSDSAPRSGLLLAEPGTRNSWPVWQHGRPAPDSCTSFSILGARCHETVSSGLRRLGPFRRVEAARAYDVLSLDRVSAAAVLQRDAPHPTGDDRPEAMAQLCVMTGSDDGEHPPKTLAIVAINPDGSLTLSDTLEPGASVAFAIRQPIDAERELQSRLAGLYARCRRPAFGLFFSCIGRGPFFYTGDDRDWCLFRERYPGMPFLGAYGSGQIASLPETRSLHNCVVMDVFTFDKPGPGDSD